MKIYFLKTLFFIKLICKTLKIKFEIPDLTFRWLPPKQPNFHLPHLTLFPFTWRNGSKLVQSKRLFWNPETWKSFLKKSLKTIFAIVLVNSNYVGQNRCISRLFFVLSNFTVFLVFLMKSKLSTTKQCKTTVFSLIFSAF